MGKVGSFTGLAGHTRGSGAVAFRLILSGTIALIVGLVVAAVSGAAGPISGVSDFKQCANGAPPSVSTACPDNWIGSILQANNSHYAEDDVVPQRVVIDLAKGSPTTGRSITLAYMTRKNGVHAYDSLATWNYTQTSAVRCADLAAADCVDPGGTASTIAVPSDSTVVADKNGPGTATSGHQLGSQVLTMYGGTLTGVSVPTHDAPSSGSTDEYAHVTVTYDVGPPGGTLADDQKVMLLFGGHIAAGLGPRGWGPGLGAGSISGGPYHIKLDGLDAGAGNVGSQDNQIMSSAILAPANIVIKKTAVGGDDTFGFTATGGISSSFSITTSGGTGTQNFTDIPAGSYSVTESSPPSGWDFSGLVCDDPTSNSSVDLGTRTASINLAAGETVTCTYTNSKRGNIVVDKVTAPSGDPQSFPFTLTGGPDSVNQSFSLTDQAAPHDSGLIRAGTYAASETSVPAGWDQTSATCSDGSPVNAIELSAGETVTCTFTNTKRGNIIVDKVTAPSGDPQSFPFTLTGGPDSVNQSFGLTDQAAPHDSGSIKPGTYAASETNIPAGWDQTGATCSDGSPVNAIDLSAGETVTCTFTNTKLAHLTLVKTVTNDNGGSASPSDFTLSAAGPSPISGPGGAESDVNAGTYTLSETNLPGYTAGSWSCVKNGGAPVVGSSIALGVGDSATCTIDNNDDPAHLIVRKVVVNDNGGNRIVSDFSFQVNGGQATSFEGDGQNDLTVDAGTYNVTEPTVAGYTTSYDNCSDLVIPNGGTETCTITNNDQPATLIVRKVVVNDNGGTKVASDFAFQVNGGAAQSFEADGQNDLIVTAGTYNVTEPAVGGYTTSYDGCSNIVLPVGGSATCTITNNDVPPGQGSISVSKSADPTTLKEPGGPVTYSVTITNTSADVSVTIDNVVDDKFGDLDDSGGNGCFDVPINLPPGGKANCTFQETISGPGGTSHVNVVTVTGHDPAGHTLTASDDARVDITPRLIDLVMVKDATSPTPLNGIVNYTLTVTNRGPDTATNVQVADPAPAGITYLSASSSQGSCSTSASLIQCSLGSMAAGQIVTIKVTGRATAVGSFTNTATVTGSGGQETNPADNVDSAVTVVPAPLKPPAVKPKAKPVPQVCLALTVKPKMITANGKPDRIVVVATAGKKRVKSVVVIVKGAGINKKMRTNKKGVAVLKLNPKKAGLITVSAIEKNQKVCGPKRIGVVGVFLPPLTG